MCPGVFVFGVRDELGPFHRQRRVLGGHGDADVLAFIDRFDTFVCWERANTCCFVDLRVVVFNGFQERGVRSAECEVSIGIGLGRVGLAGQGVFRDGVGLVHR